MRRRAAAGPCGPLVVDPLSLEQPEEEVWRFLSYPEGIPPPPPMRARIRFEIENSRGSLRPRGVFRIDPGEEAGPYGLPAPPPIDDGGELAAPGRPGGENGASPGRPAWAALALATVGAHLEEQVRHRLAGGDATGALLLDAIGSAAAEEAADRLSAMIGARLREGDAPPVTGGFRGCRVSPGYGDWPLESQRRIFAALPHEAIGVHLLGSLLMVPRKSISFALWLDADGRPLADLAGCSRCPDRRCRLRRSPPGRATHDAPEDRREPT